MTTINIRIDENMKRKASRTLAHLGIDMSSAVKLFLNQVVIEKELPFVPSVNHALIRARWDKEIKEAKKSKGFTSVDDALKDALK